jgi:transcriptional regulator with XRE-family HTH domain
MRAMDAIRLGLQVRALRRRRGWRQLDVGQRAALSRSAIGRIERGDIRGLPIDSLSRTAEALGGRLDISLRWHGEGLDRLLDAEHAALVDALVRLYQACAWEAAVEVSFAIGGERGSIDALSYRPDLRLVAVNEVKSVVPDAQATVQTLDRKSRLALAIARQHGWDADRVARFLVIGDSRTSRRRVDTHSALFRAAFPLHGRDAAAFIRSPSRDPVSGLLFLSPAHRVSAQRGSVGRHRVQRPQPSVDEQRRGDRS